MYPTQTFDLKQAGVMSASPTDCHSTGDNWKCDAETLYVVRREDSEPINPDDARAVAKHLKGRVALVTDMQDAAERGAIHCGDVGVVDHSPDLYPGVLRGGAGTRCGKEVFENANTYWRSGARPGYAPKLERRRFENRELNQLSGEPSCLTCDQEKVIAGMKEGKGFFFDETTRDRKTSILSTWAWDGDKEVFTAPAPVGHQNADLIKCAMKFPGRDVGNEAERHYWYDTKSDWTLTTEPTTAQRKNPWKGFTGGLQLYKVKKGKVGPCTVTECDDISKIEDCNCAYWGSGVTAKDRAMASVEGSYRIDPRCGDEFDKGDTRTFEGKCAVPSGQSISSTFVGGRYDMSWEDAIQECQDDEDCGGVACSGVPMSITYKGGAVKPSKCGPVKRGFAGSEWSLKGAKLPKKVVIGPDEHGAASYTKSKVDAAAVDTGTEHCDWPAYANRYPHIKSAAGDGTGRDGQNSGARIKNYYLRVGKKAGHDCTTGVLRCPVGRTLVSGGQLSSGLDTCCEGGGRKNTAVGDCRFRTGGGSGQMNVEDIGAVNCYANSNRSRCEARGNNNKCVWHGGRDNYVCKSGKGIPPTSQMVKSRPLEQAVTTLHKYNYKVWDKGAPSKDMQCLLACANCFKSCKKSCPVGWTRSSAKPGYRCVPPPDWDSQWAEEMEQSEKDWCNNRAHDVGPHWWDLGPHCRFGTGGGSGQMNVEDIGVVGNCYAMTNQFDCEGLDNGKDLNCVWYGDMGRYRAEFADRCQVSWPQCDQGSDVPMEKCWEAALASELNRKGGSMHMDMRNSEDYAPGCSVQHPGGGGPGGTQRVTWNDNLGAKPWRGSDGDDGGGETPL